MRRRTGVGSGATGPGPPAQSEYMVSFLVGLAELRWLRSCRDEQQRSVFPGARGSLVHVCRAQLAGLMAGVGLSSPPNPPRPTCSMCRFGAGVLKDGCTRPSVAPTTSLSLFWLVLSRRVLAARGGAPRSGRPLRSHTRPPVPCACVCVCACVCERVRGACGRHHCTLVGGRRQAASL